MWEYTPIANYDISARRFPKQVISGTEHDISVRLFPKRAIPGTNHWDVPQQIFYGANNYKAHKCMPVRPAAI